MLVLKFSPSQSLKTCLKIAAVLLLLLPSISGCANKYLLPGFHESEYKELKAGETYTALFDSLCVSKEYAQTVMGVDSIEPSKILKEKLHD